MYTMQNFAQTLTLLLTFVIVFHIGFKIMKNNVTELIQKSIEKVDRYLSNLKSNQMNQLKEALDLIESKYENEFIEKNKRIFLHKTYPLVQKYTCDIEYFLYLIYDIFNRVIDNRNFFFRCGIDRDLMEDIEKCRNEVKEILREYDNLSRILLRYYTLDKSPELINLYSRVFYYFITR